MTANKRNIRTIVLSTEFIGVDAGWYNYSEHFRQGGAEIGDYVGPSATIKYILLWPDNESWISSFGEFEKLQTVCDHS
jgi:hypothetical protein